MIQRIQTVWLLLIAIFAAVTFRFPFFTGELLVDNKPATTSLDATTTIWLSVMTVLAGATAFVAIFLFDNRRRQMKFCYAGLVFTVALIVMYFMEMSHFTKGSGSIALWCIFPFAIFGCYILALRAIKKDENLIKSMDRLR